MSVPYLADTLDKNGYSNVVIAGRTGDRVATELKSLGIKFVLFRSWNKKLALVPGAYLRALIKFRRLPDFIFFHNLWNFMPLMGFLLCRILECAMRSLPEVHFSLGH